jgi:hypothetical protein
MIDSVTQRGGPRERSRFERELSDLGLTPAAEREAASLRAAVSRASTRFDPIAASRRNRYFAETLGWKKRANDVLRLVSAGAPEQSFTRAIAYWQRRSGLPADGIVGPRTWAAMRRAMDGGASREFERENGGPQPRLSAGALGDAFASLQKDAGVPDAAVRRLAGSSTSRNMALTIDNAYVALPTLMEAVSTFDMSADGRITSPARFQGRRVLFVQKDTTTRFRRALSVDNSERRADIVDIALPQVVVEGLRDRILARDWVDRIVCTAAQIAQATVERKPGLPIAERVKNCVEAQTLARLDIDAIFKELDDRAAKDDPKFGARFQDFKIQTWVEVAYHPVDLAFDGPFVLTNLEQCTLLELMEDARRDERLDDAMLDSIMKEMNGIVLGGPGRSRQAAGVAVPGRHKGPTATAHGLRIEVCVVLLRPAGDRPSLARSGRSQQQELEAGQRREGHARRARKGVLPGHRYLSQLRNKVRQLSCASAAISSTRCSS